MVKRATASRRKHRSGPIALMGACRVRALHPAADVHEAAARPRSRLYPHRNAFNGFGHANGLPLGEERLQLFSSSWAVTKPRWSRKGRLDFVARR